MARCIRGGVSYKRHQYSWWINSSGRVDFVDPRICKACGEQEKPKAKNED